MTDTPKLYQYRSTLDPILTWATLDALKAWREEHPHDIRAHVVTMEEMP